MLDAAICPWCGDLEETSLHAIIRCPRVMELWEDSGCKELVEYEGESWCELLESWKQRDVKLRQKAAILAWNIWMERNLKVFEDKSSPNAMILARVTRLAHEHDMFTKQVRANYVPRHPRSANSWVAPLASVVKINSDASLVTEGWIGLGVVTKEVHGDVLFAATRRIRHSGL